MPRESVEAFEVLKEYLVQNHNAKVVSGGKEICKRCHLCGDSVKDHRSRHMYIGIDSRSGLIVYNCFKCNSSGVVDGKFIRSMDNITDTSSIVALCNDYNRDKMNLPQNKLLRESEHIILRDPILRPRESDESYKKLAKLNHRLGTSFLFSDLSKYKIILNLKDFLIENGIRTISRNQTVIDYLDMFFVGFLSVDNSYITMRRMVKENVLPEFVDFRYINYNIFNKISNANRHYIIPSAINPMDPRPIKIYIAEGPFDALSVKLNLVKEDDSQTIVAAVGGKSYWILIRFFIEQYGLLNVEYHLCPDADVPDEKLQWMGRQLRQIGIPVFIHRNRYPGEKDFGVHPSRINEYVYQLN